MLLRIIVTGGTFDKEYDEINGNLYFKDTHIREILNLGRSKLEVAITKLMLIDSLKMTTKDRGLIVDSCKAVHEKQIVITHGTDTMTKTAEVIAKANLDKTIVVTGAMIPYKFGSSDGLFNLSSALAFAQSLKTGVYISMNGRFFNWNNVYKNKKTGTFEEIE